MDQVAVIVPSYLVEDRIEATLLGIPAWIDRIIVVDDASYDETVARAQKVATRRVEILRHSRNLGVGAAILTGYRHALAQGAHVMIVMAGDNQMCPSDLERLIAPIANGEADYVKGNRLVHPEWRRMPILRRIGTSLLAALTRRLSGLQIGDSQCGYTALSRRAALTIPLAELWPRYGYPGHLLLTLAEAGLHVAEVPVRPVYQGERSGLRLWHLVWIALIVLGRAGVLRLRRLRVNKPAIDGQR